ncbi:MAG TPA: hypothetical protein VFN74_17745 [Chloroflexota bacterium]|nr:hypothetical protein [Chloroflexota bacterium]
MSARLLYCIPGAWTDEWFDNPNAWWQWACVFKGWSGEQWLAFYQRWRTASHAKRSQMSAEHGLYFFDWRRLPGGSLWASSRAAAALIEEDLAQLPAGADVTLIGHSKGGSALKHLLARGAKPSRAIFIDAPLDRLRELAGMLLRLRTEPCSLDGSCGIPMATINNWLDPSGGRLRGVRNYQTFIWQDYLYPYPPHGMKGFLAQRVLADLGALPNNRAPTTSTRAARAQALGGDPGGAQRERRALVDYVPEGDQKPA